MYIVVVVVAHADSIRGVGFLPSFICVSVCFLHDISKTDAARITKLDIEMYHDESGKTTHFGFRRSQVRKKHCRHGSLHSSECWLRLVVIIIIINYDLKYYRD